MDSRPDQLPAEAGLRYQRLADDMAEAIASGLLRVGERLPSVRATCAQRSVSPSTVFQAYGLLEAWGLIEARPRSGYYVRAQRRPQRAAPLAAMASAEATPVAFSELAFELLHASQDARLVPLGSAFPASHLFPFAELARCGARAMRQLRPAQITSALTAGDARLRHALRRRYAMHGVTLGDDELGRDQRRHGSAEPKPAGGDAAWATWWSWKRRPSMLRCRCWTAWACARWRCAPTRPRAWTCRHWRRCWAATAWPPAGA